MKWKVVLYDVVVQSRLWIMKRSPGRMVLSLGHASDTTRQRKEARCARGQGLGKRGGGEGAGKSGTTRRRAKAERDIAHCDDDDLTNDDDDDVAGVASRWCRDGRECRV
jgi:hypothetical protein